MPGQSHLFEENSLERWRWQATHSAMVPVSSAGVTLLPGPGPIRYTYTLFNKCYNAYESFIAYSNSLLMFKFIFLCTQSHTQCNNLSIASHFVGSRSSVRGRRVYTQSLEVVVCAEPPHHWWTGSMMTWPMAINLQRERLKISKGIQSSDRRG